MIQIHRNCISVSASITKRMRKAALGGFVVFNPDTKRLQKTIKHNNKFMRSLKEYLRKSDIINDNRFVGGAVAMHSLSGCKQQEWHTDYDPSTISKLKHKPMGVIIALEDGAKFVTPSKLYKLCKGDMLLFDGDVVHAGGGYNSPNTRLHLYLDVHDAHRSRNKTWIIKNLKNAKK